MANVTYTRVRVGDVIGRWTITGSAIRRRLPCGERFTYFPCRCSCGTQREVSWRTLSSAGDPSCGCRAHELTSARTIRHGDTRKRLYAIWGNIKKRCLWPDDPAYANYRGRGITLCAEWHESYEAFRGWALSSGYQRGLTIDRFDNDQGYSPENCRWTTYLEQNRNRRSNHHITAFGETKVMSAWAEDPRCVVQYHTLGARLKIGWTAERALTTPVRPRLD